MGLAFFVICLDRQSADWLTAFATHFLNGMRIISDNENLSVKFYSVGEFFQKQ